MLKPHTEVMVMVGPLASDDRRAAPGVVVTVVPEADRPVLVRYDTPYHGSFGRVIKTGWYREEEVQIRQHSPSEFETKLRALTQEYAGDAEAFESRAITLMTDLLTSLGYQAGVAIYNQFRG